MKTKIIIFLLFLLSYQSKGNTEPTLILLGHKEGVNICKFSNDGKTLLSGSKDGIIKLWNVSENYKLIKEIEVGDDPITAISFSHKGDQFAVGTLEKLYIYDFATCKLISKKKNAHASFVKSANFSPDDKLIVTSSWKEDALTIWNYPDLKKSIQLSESIWTDEAFFSPDGKFLLSCNHDNVCKVWDVNTGNITRTFAGHDDWVYAIRLSSDMKYLITGSFDKTLRKWDFNTGKLIATFNGHKDGISYMTLSPDNSSAVSGSVDGSIILWNLNDEKDFRMIREKGSAILNLAYSPDGKTIAAALADHSILIWNIDIAGH